MSRRSISSRLSCCPAVWVLAIVVRFAYLDQLQQGPLFDVLMGDAVGYDQWAREIAGGDWFGKDVFYQAPLYPYFMGAWYAVVGTKLSALRALSSYLERPAASVLPQPDIDSSLQLSASLRASASRCIPARSFLTASFRRLSSTTSS